MDQATLIARIRERLDTLKLDPVPLGVRIDRGRDYVTDILKGRKKTIPNDILTPLAIALQCDERYFTDSAFDRPGRPRRTASDEDLARYAEAAKHGFNLLAWREYKRLNLQDVADETGLTPGTVSDLENGLAVPDPDHLERFARAFETRPGRLRDNPFLAGERVARLVSITEALDINDQAALLDLAEVLERRQVG